MAKNLTNGLGIGRLQAYIFHLQTNGTIVSRDRTLARDLACFLCTGDSDGNEPISLANSHCNTGACAATDMTPFKAVGGVKALQA